MGSIFKASVPDEPKVDESKIRMKERMRRRRAAGEASTNVVNRPTLGGPSNG